MIGCLALICFAGHLCVILLSPGYNPREQTFWRDDHVYFHQSSALAQAWREGFFPEITRKGSPPYMGTLHTGYQRTLAAVFYLAGDNATVGRLFNAFCGTLLPLFSALLAHLVFGDPKRGRSELLRAPPVLAALLATMHPSQFYYSQFLLKDVYAASWFLAVTVLLCQALLRKNAAACIAAAAAVYLLFTVRAYAAISLLAGAGAYLLLLIPRRTAVTGLLLSATALLMLMRYTAAGSMQGAQLWHSLLELAPAHARSPGAIAKHLLAGIPRIMLAPFSWIYARGDRPLYALYPGMWFLYIVVYPAMFTGLARVIRHNSRPAVIPLVATIGGCFVLLISSYGGDAPRQRFYMEYIAVAFAALGWTTPKRRVFTAWYILLATYAAGQIITVKMRGL